LALCGPPTQIIGAPTDHRFWCPRRWLRPVWPTPDGWHGVWCACWHQAVTPQTVSWESCPVRSSLTTKQPRQTCCLLRDKDACPDAFNELSTLVWVGLFVFRLSSIVDYRRNIYFCSKNISANANEAKEYTSCSREKRYQYFAHNFKTMTMLVLFSAAWCTQNSGQKR